MFSKIFPVLLTGIALTGVVTNIYKLPVCFYLWTISNASWAVVNYTAYRKHKEHKFLWQCVLFSIYFCLAIWGILSW